MHHLKLYQYDHLFNCMTCIILHLKSHFLFGVFPVSIWFMAVMSNISPQRLTFPPLIFHVFIFFVGSLFGWIRSSWVLFFDIHHLQTFKFILCHFYHDCWLQLWFGELCLFFFSCFILGFFFFLMVYVGVWSFFFPFWYMLYFWMISFSFRLYCSVLSWFCSTFRWKSIVWVTFFFFFKKNIGFISFINLGPFVVILLWIFPILFLCFWHSLCYFWWPVIFHVLEKGYSLYILHSLSPPLPDFTWFSGRVGGLHHNLHKCS